MAKTLTFSDEVLFRVDIVQTVTSFLI